MCERQPSIALIKQVIKAVYVSYSHTRAVAQIATEKATFMRIAGANKEQRS